MQNQPTKPTAENNTEDKSDVMEELKETQYNIKQMAQCLEYYNLGRRKVYDEWIAFMDMSDTEKRAWAANNLYNLIK